MPRNSKDCGFPNVPDGKSHLDYEESPDSPKPVVLKGLASIP